MLKPFIFSSLHHVEYSYFSIEPQSPTQVGFSENASPPWEGGGLRDQGLWGNGNICLYGEGRALLSWEAAQAIRGGHPTLVTPVHSSFGGDSFHFRAGVSGEAFTTLGLKLSHVLTASTD